MPPLLIGVVGGSGSGKTTVARAIYDFLGMNAAFIDMDAYYKDLSHLTLEQRRQINFDHPDSIDTTLMADHLARLRVDGIDSTIIDVESRPPRCLGQKINIL